jgi:hypothetical protein
MHPLLQSLWQEPFKRYLIVGLVLLFFFLFFSERRAGEVSTDKSEVHFFYHPNCNHCRAQESFNEELMQRYPTVSWVCHDTSIQKESELLQTLAAEKGIPQAELGVPATFIGDRYFIGFASAETTGREVEGALQAFAALRASSAVPTDTGRMLRLPIIGEIDPLGFSLPLLAVVLGLVDGFNPCAMWVLVYLISLMTTLNDRRRVWILAGSFLAASGILYFLFLTAWLNAFLFIGYMRPVTLLVGVFALGAGILSVKEFMETEGPLVCEVGDTESKRRTMVRVERLVSSPLTWATTGGIIVLAFAVNSIEFVCSSAIPAIFTQVLALSSLSGWQYYGCILIYDFFFMLDDLVIFGLAAVAVNSAFGERYSRLCRLIGGIILSALGVVLVFFPRLLR